MSQSRKALDLAPLGVLLCKSLMHRKEYFSLIEGIHRAWLHMHFIVLEVSHAGPLHPWERVCRHLKLEPCLRKSFEAHKWVKWFTEATAHYHVS